MADSVYEFCPFVLHKRGWLVVSQTPALDQPVLDSEVEVNETTDSIVSLFVLHRKIRRTRCL